MNVLLIVSDDLRPELDLAYGGRAKTPYLDRFVKSEGTVVFDRAYVQQAICCPTRSSFLTGRRPDTTKVWDLKTQFRLSNGNEDIVTLPQYFRQHGYYTAGAGKVFHPVKFKGQIDDVAGGSWSAPYYHPHGGKVLGNNMSMCWNENASPDEGQFRDNLIAAHTLDTLANISAHQLQPFFVAVGFHRPHLPWDVPERYFDMYSEEEVGLADHPSPPTNYNITGAQPWSWDPQSGPRHCGPLKHSTLPEYGLVPNATARKFRHGYLAAVSQTDENTGKVLRALDAHGFRNSTIVVFIGDHGWQLGDLGEFGKKTNFERATRTPFIVRDPTTALASPEGEVVRSQALVEFVSLMPTLVDLAGLPAPPLCPVDSRTVDVCVEGPSLAPLVHSTPNPVHWRGAAFMQYAHCMHDEHLWHDGCANAAEPRVMGYAIRTRRYRYVEWVGFNKTTTPPTIHWDQLHGTELYDHGEDDSVENVAESVNLVAEPAMKDVVAKLSTQLHAGWRALA